MIDFKNKNYLSEIKRVRIAENRNLETCLRLNRNERVQNWPPGFIEKIFSEVPNYALSVYPDSSQIYNKLAKFLDVPSDRLLLTNGIDGAIKVIFDICINAGDRIGVLSPTYAMYQVYSKIYQVEMQEIGYDLDALKLDREALNSYIDSGPRLIFIPNPNQPIEDPLSIEDMIQISSRAEKNNVIIVFDEAYFHFGCQTALSLLETYKNTIVMRTFSKAFGVPSIRLGYLVSCAKNMNVLSKSRQAYESNFLTDTVATYLLDNFELVTEYIEQVGFGREYLKGQLIRLGLKAHGDIANYLLLNLENAELRDSLNAHLTNDDIYVKGNYSEPMDNYILVTCGPKEKMEKLVNSIKKWPGLAYLKNKKIL